MLIASRIFTVLFLFSGLFLLVGLIRPNWVILWGKPETKTRKKVVILSIAASILFIAGIVMTTPT